MPKALDRRDYVRHALDHNLEFLDQVPENTRVPVKWRCILCGREHVVSFASFQIKKSRANKHGAPYYSCSCQHAGVVGLEEAKAMFLRHGMELEYSLIPLNLNQKLPATIIETGERVECTLFWLYPNCHYHAIPKRIRELIGREE